MLRDPRGSFEVVGRVMRERRSHRSARHVRASGLGIQLDVVPEPFFRLLVELGLGYASVAPSELAVGVRAADPSADAPHDLRRGPSGRRTTRPPSR